MFLLKLIVDFVHLVRTIVYYFFAISYCVGRSITLVLTRIWNICTDFIVAIVIVADELYRFLGQLDQSLSAIAHYVSNCANNGINSAVDTLDSLLYYIIKFSTKTIFQTRLILTGIGTCIGKFFILLHDALALIGHSCLWLLTLTPRILVYVFIEIGDMLVFAISGIGQLLARSLQVLLDDIFQLTIAVFVIYLVIRKRRHLVIFVLVLYQNVKMRFRHIVASSSARIRFNNWFNYRNSTDLEIQSNVLVTTRLPRQSEDFLNTQSHGLNFQSCVICRDRLKSVLLLPCKHLCLCQGCADTMLMRSNIQYCPLCRSFIEQSMSVYV